MFLRSFALVCLVFAACSPASVRDDGAGIAGKAGAEAGAAGSAGRNAIAGKGGTAGMAAAGKTGSDRDAGVTVDSAPVADAGPGVDAAVVRADVGFVAMDKVWRIQPMGDSITASEFGYRGHLYSKLTRAGYHVDFVGGEKGAPASGGDAEHEGHGGFSIGPDGAQYCDFRGGKTDCNAFHFNLFDNLDAFLAKDPDVLLLLIGVNDMYTAPKPAQGADGIYRPVDPKQAPAKLAALVAEIRKRKPNLKILLSSLLQQKGNTDGWADYQAVCAKAREIGEASANDFVTFVDLHAVAMQAGDFVDDLHPSDSGGKKTANGWFPALAALLGAPPSPPLFNEDFLTAPSSKWKMESGDASKIDNGKLVLNTFAGSARARLDQTFSAPYTLRARLRMSGGAGGNKVRVVFNETDSEASFVEFAGGNDAKASFGHRAGSGQSGVVTTPQAYPVSNLGLDVEIRSESTGVTVRVRKDGTWTTLATKAAEAGGHSGRVAFEVEYNYAEIYDIAVSND